MTVYALFVPIVGAIGVGGGLAALGLSILLNNAPYETGVFEKNRAQPGELTRAIKKIRVPRPDPPVEEPVYNTNAIAYMNAHLVRNSNLNYEYCPRLTRRGRPDFMDGFPLASLAYMIYAWGERARDPNSPNVHFLQNLHDPFTEVVMRTVTNSQGERIDLPVYIRAIIHRDNLPRPGSRTSIPQNVRGKMADMNNIKGEDDAGHMLAFSLGGGMLNAWNYVPQAKRLNRNVGAASLWLKEERDIARFLMDNPTGRVEWDMFIIYEDPLGDNYRPVAFCLQHTDYDDSNAAHEGREWCFSNDPYDECRYDRRDPNNNGVPTPPPPGITG